MFWVTVELDMSVLTTDQTTAQTAPERRWRQ